DMEIIKVPFIPQKGISFVWAGKRPNSALSLSSCRHAFSRHPAYDLDSGLKPAGMTDFSMRGKPVYQQFLSP
ncbi:MAG: hypothetical protein ABR523_00940, partial [Desulfurivibrionaceae bacterium]